MAILYRVLQRIKDELAKLRVLPAVREEGAQTWYNLSENSAKYFFTYVVLNEPNDSAIYFCTLHESSIGETFVFPSCV